LDTNLLLTLATFSIPAVAWLALLDWTRHTLAGLGVLNLAGKTPFLFAFAIAFLLAPEFSDWVARHKYLFVAFAATNRVVDPLLQF